MMVSIMMNYDEDEIFNQNKWCCAGWSGKLSKKSWSYVILTDGMLSLLPFGMNPLMSPPSSEFSIKFSCGGIEIAKLKIIYFVYWMHCKVCLSSLWPLLSAHLCVFVCVCLSVYLSSLCFLKCTPWILCRSRMFCVFVCVCLSVCLSVFAVHTLNPVYVQEPNFISQFWSSKGNHVMSIWEGNV